MAAPPRSSRARLRREGAGSDPAETSLISPMWDFISAQLVEEEGMLPNYDAKGVAEVMGLAFVHRPKDGKGQRGPGASVFINVDGDTLLIVSRFSHVKGRRCRAIPFPGFHREGGREWPSPRVPAAGRGGDRRRRQGEGLGARARHRPEDVSRAARDEALAPGERVHGTHSPKFACTPAAPSARRPRRANS